MTDISLSAVKVTAADYANRILRFVGAEINRLGTQKIAEKNGFLDIEPWVSEIVNKVWPYTMTGPERTSALCHAVRYLARNGIEGDIVECGVWRGGSMMAAAMTLLGEGDTSRRLHLFDTFAGMPPPAEVDRTFRGQSAADLLETSDKETSFVWACAGLDDVRSNMASTGYPMDRVRFVQGLVEDTIPQQAPERIALLRLDTDWYESTKHELVHLYPRLVPGGVLILDDYGHWEGARRAVDEYIRDNKIKIFLSRIDYSGRLAIKCE